MSNRIVKNTRTSKEPSFPELLRMDCNWLLDIFTCVYIIVITAVLPLYNTGSYARIGSEKQALFISFLEIYWKILLPFLLLSILLHIVHWTGQWTKNRSLSGLRTKFSIVDICVSGYLVAVLLSYFLSDYRESAVIGSPNWSMGTLSQVTFCVTYFLISRFWKKRIWMVGLMLPVSAILYVLGYLNRFGVWPIPMGNSDNPQFISLAGNINWYCGYLVTILFGAVFIAWRYEFSKSWQRLLMYGYLFIGFGALVTNGSSSGILTLLGILFVLLLLSLSDNGKLIRYFEMLMILGAACLFTYGIRKLFPGAITYQETTNNLLTDTFLPVLLTLLAFSGILASRIWKQKNNYPGRILGHLARFMALAAISGALLIICLIIANTIHPGSIGPLSDLAIFHFSQKWGSQRGATWMAGALTWWELPFGKKWIGVGPDCMGFYLNTDASEALMSMVKSVWPSLTLSNAHCEWLTILVNLGILGLCNFAGLILSSVYGFLRKGTDISLSHHYITGACGLAVLAYSIHNVVSFQQVLNTPVMFILLGIGASYSRSSDAR